jgi:hypothetical protein
MFFSSILSLVVLSSFSTSAFASPSLRNATSGCSHLSVHLNGTQPATQTCLDGQISPNGVSEPDCGATGIELILWWNANYSGPNICFSGTGSTELDSYPAPALTCLCTSWDKQASSFEMRDSSTVKTIYTDKGENGASFHATVYQGNLANTPVGDDNASSISIEPLH